MIEDLIKAHTAALIANTEALNANTAALQMNSCAAVTAAPKSEAATPVTPTPTKTKATKPPVDDTPSVPAAAAPAPGQPVAAEHVDVDETIATIQTVVKKKMMEGVAADVKAAWTEVLKGYGVPRIAELRNDPAKLVEALGKANAL